MSEAGDPDADPERSDSGVISKSESESESESILDCVDCLEPVEAFSIVASEPRLAILEALWDADGDRLRFSELRERVGMRDSAQFNYHLGKLTDQFVRKTDQGYELRHAGEKVVRAVLAGSFTEHPEIGPFPAPGSCVDCGGPLRARYADERLAITCRDCGRGHGEYPFPPGGLNDRTRVELLDAFDQRVRHLHCLAKDGVCPECGGRMETTVTGTGEGECCLDVRPRADHVCRQCGHSACSAVGLALLDQSDVVAFHDDHGIDLSETPYWQLEWCVSDAPVTVRSRDPWRLDVAIDLDDERLTVTLDGDLQIVATEPSER